MKTGNEKYHVSIGWLYPELMSTYGDRGNVLVLKRRLFARGIGVTIRPIGFETDEETLRSCDVVLGGGAQDRQQALVADDLRSNKRQVLKEMFDQGIPGLFVCGSPQLLGHSYMTGEGRTINGLGIFDMETRHFGHTKPRLIGNLVAVIGDRFKVRGSVFRQTIVGFENHGGRTYVGRNCMPFARVIHGFGNNGEDQTEGAVSGNWIATYSHGPFLSKNPHVADWLIFTALRVKYGKRIVSLKKLDDALEWRAHDSIVMRFAQDYEPLLP
jgi:hypothetical protein